MGSGGFTPSHKIFRGPVALEVEATDAPVTKTRLRPVPTISWAAARELHAGSGVSGGGYDWQGRALRIQVTPREMPDVMAALLGYLDDVTFTNHGPQRNKSYRIENLGNATSRLTFSGAEAGKFVFTLQPADRFAVTTLCFRAFLRQHGGLGSESLLMMLRDTYLGTTAHTLVDRSTTLSDPA